MLPHEPPVIVIVTAQFPVVGDLLAVVLDGVYGNLCEARKVYGHPAAEMNAAQRTVWVYSIPLEWQLTSQLSSTIR
jgi:hypothetical protein